MMEFVTRMRFMVRAFVCGGLLSLSAPLIYPNVLYAAEKPVTVWDDSLKDLDGVWITNRGIQSKLYFSRDVSGFIDIDGTSLARPISVNRASGDVTFLLVPTDVDRLALMRGMAIMAQLGPANLGKNDQPQDEAPWTLRRVWDKQRQSFSFVLYSPAGGGVAYSFVRDLTPQEEASFANVRAQADQAEAALAARIAKTKEQDAAKQRSKEAVIAKLSSPEVRAAADRIGIGQEFYRMTPAAQAESIADALRMNKERLASKEAWLKQMERENPVSDLSADRLKRQMAQLKPEIADLRSWLADFVTVDAALKGEVSATAPLAMPGQRGSIGIVVYNAVAEPNGRGFKVAVREVEPGSPAEGAGLKVGDVLDAVNGEKVAGVGDIGRLFGQIPIGAKATLAIVRDERPQQVELRIPGTPAN